MNKLAEIFFFGKNAFSLLGPFHTSEKSVYSDKFSVIINALQMRLVCGDFTNFVQDGLIFKGTADNFCRR